MPRPGAARRHVGIDLDNTVIDYEHVFGPVAASLGLLGADAAAAGKAAVKAALRAGPHGEEGWMRVQGKAYGARIGLARPYAGAESVLRALAADGVRVSVVSHKTRHGHFDEERVDLWEAARGWLAERGLAGTGGAPVAADDVHFLETRDAKVARIAAIGCEAFVDDLPEVLLHPAFPDGVRRIWFAPAAHADEGPGLEPARGWDAVGAALGLEG